MRKNPMQFLGCCEKCGMPRAECVCVRNIEIKKGNGIDGKGLSELLKAQRYSAEDVREKQIDFVNWLYSEQIMINEYSFGSWLHKGAIRTTEELHKIYEEQV